MYYWRKKLIQHWKKYGNSIWIKIYTLNVSKRIKRMKTNRGNHILNNISYFNRLYKICMKTKSHLRNIHIFQVVWFHQKESSISEKKFFLSNVKWQKRIYRYKLFFRLVWVKLCIVISLYNTIKNNHNFLICTKI